MGITLSKRHRHHQPHQNQVNHHQQPVTQSYSYRPPLRVTPLEPIPLPPPPPPLPPPPSTSAPDSFRFQTPAQLPEPPSYSFAANAPYHAPSSPPQHFPPAQLPPPPPSYIPNYNYNHHHYSNYDNFRPMNVMGQHSNYRPYLLPPMRWGPIPSPLPPPQVPYVDHQSAKKIKNDVNIHKDTIRLQVDVLNHDCQLVTFTFDALVDGSINIFYFAKEGANCKFTPSYPEIMPVKIPFQKGLGQKFCQPSGTGIDLGFFNIDDLSKPSPGEDIYPLVISAAESHVASTPMDEQPYKEVMNTSPNAQITQAVLEKKDEGKFLVKIIKQILWNDGVRYELREIYGISSPDGTAISDVGSGKECVICMTEENNTAVLPCRHMCMCRDCAKELRLQSNKCPICRQPIQELLEIKLDEEAET